MEKYIYLILWLFLLSCSGPEEKDPQQPQPLELDKEAGWGADIRLSIVETMKTDSATVYKAVSTYHGKNLGLLVSVPAAATEGGGFGRGITFTSLGKESDYLLQILGTLYNAPPEKGKHFVRSISVTFADLRELLKALQKENSGSNSVAAQYKLFLENDKDYAEVYLNINPQEGWLEIAEKDEGYRSALVTMLSE